MRALGALPLLAIGCTGDILPITLPGPLFRTEAGNIPGAMHTVREGFEGPIAAGGGAEPVLLERRDGGWLPRTVPSEWRGPIRDVAVAGGTIYLAGDAGQIAGGDAAGIVSIASNTEIDLRAVFARGPADAFFAGEGGLLRWNGEEIARVETASIAPHQRFFGVWGDASSIIVVGDDGLAFAISGDRAELTDTGTTATLRAVHGRSKSDIYAAGGDDRGAVLRWDGARWIDIAVPTFPRLHAVFAGRGRVWIAGDAGYLAYWDGTVWTEVLTGAQAPLTGALEWDRDLFVSGGNTVDPSAPGFVARYGE